MACELYSNKAVILKSNTYGFNIESDHHYYSQPDASIAGSKFIVNFNNVTFEKNSPSGARNYYNNASYQYKTETYFYFDNNCKFIDNYEGVTNSVQANNLNFGLNVIGANITDCKSKKKVINNRHDLFSSQRKNLLRNQYKHLKTDVQKKITSKIFVVFVLLNMSIAT